MKTASAGLDTHFQQEVTSATTCFKMTRVDGTVFTFTEHDVSIPIDADGLGELSYVPTSSYNRSAVKNDDSLAVDNLDLTGVLNNSDVDETELRRGLFDFAEIKVFMVNWKDLTQGVLKIRRGWLGEVTITPNGFFTAELRGLTQVFARSVLELFGPECRTDLGSTACTVPILPDVVVRGTAYAVGDYVLAASELETIPSATFLAPLDTDADDDSINAAVGTIGSAAVLQAVVTKFGTGAMEFGYNAGAVDPSLSFVSYPDIPAYVIGSSEFTIECWVRFKDLTETVQVVMSHYQNLLDERAWHLTRNGGDLHFFGSDDGTGAAPAASILGATTWAIDTWYHIAVTRDASNDVRMFVDGVQVGITTAMTFAFYDPDATALLYLGKFRSTGFDDRSLVGFIDDPRIVVGSAMYTSGFTPPIVAHQSPSEVAAGLPCTSFDDRIYVCTTAGTTAALLQPAYDTTVTNTTTDGSAVFTAQQAWSRCIEVTAVGSDVRKSFTVTELTPNSGSGIDGRDQFPADSLNGGVVVWETGLNAGTAMEVRDFVADDGVTIEQDVLLFLDLHFDITIGDTARIYRGCLKRLLEDCRDVFSNPENHRAEAYLPGIDSFVQTPGAFR